MRIRTNITLLVLCLVSLLNVWGCRNGIDSYDQGTATLDATVNGKSIMYAVGQKLEVKVEAFTDGGYQWDTVIGDPRVVAADGVPSYTSNNTDPKLVGGSSTATIKFIAAARGRSVITLIHHRAWMKDVPPIQSISFTIVVE